MNVFTIACVLTLIFLNIGCQSGGIKDGKKNLRTIDGKSTYQYFDDDGKLEAEQDGFVNDSGEFIANGIYKEYYENGKIKTLGYFKNGQKDSLCSFYSEKGVVTRTNNFSNDRRIGRQYEFYESGKLKTIYYVLNETTKLGMATINYDQHGEIASITGKSCLAYVWHEQELYNNNDTLAIFNLVATGDKLKTLLKVKIFDKKMHCYFEGSYRDFKFERYIGTPFIYLEKSFKQGNNTYMSITELRDSLTNKLVKCDSSIISINVK